MFDSEDYMLIFLAVVLSIFITRLIGAWMFRITDVIEELKKVRKVLERDSKYSEEYLAKPTEDEVKENQAEADNQEGADKEIKSNTKGFFGKNEMVALLIFLALVAIVFILKLFG